MNIIDDKDVWTKLPWSLLWVYDKLILSKKLGHLCGPAGVPVPEKNDYVVRPITNIHMMGKGARIQNLSPEDEIEPGYFWCEVFKGEHITVDYHYGQQKTTAKGYPRQDRLDRFDKWELIDKEMPFPERLGTDVCNYHRMHNLDWTNIEYIGGKVIEVHFRYNDDFENHNGKVIYPVWKDEQLPQPKDSIWYDSPCGDRLGHWIVE